MFYFTFNILCFLSYSPSVKDNGPVVKHLLGRAELQKVKLCPGPKSKAIYGNVRNLLSTTWCLSSNFRDFTDIVRYLLV